MTDSGARRVTGPDAGPGEATGPGAPAPGGTGGPPTGQVDDAVQAASKIGRLFDLRPVVGGLMTLYGVILTVKGAFDSRAAVHRAAGVRINLWTGLGMLVLGLLFFLWARLAPLRLDPETLHDELAMGAAPTVEGHS